MLGCKSLLIMTNDDYNDLLNEFCTKNVPACWTHITDYWFRDKIIKPFLFIL